MFEKLQWTLYSCLSKHLVWHEGIKTGHKAWLRYISVLQSLPPHLNVALCYLYVDLKPSPDLLQERGVWLGRQCHRSNAFPLLQNHSKESYLNTRFLSHFLTLVTVHMVAATGDPLSALYIWKMDWQVLTAIPQFTFHVLIVVFFFFLFALHFLCASVALFVFSFNVLFTFQFPNWKAEMHLCFSDTPENMCIYIYARVYIYVCVYKYRYVLEKMLFSRKFSKTSRMCLMMSLIQENSK